MINAEKIGNYVYDISGATWTDNLSLTDGCPSEDGYINDFLFDVTINGQVVGYTTLGSNAADYIRIFNGENPFTLEGTRKEFLESLGL